MKRDKRPAWRILLERFIADPTAFIEELKKYARDVDAGADPIEALHGHICSPTCWHQQMDPRDWPLVSPKCERCGRFHTGDCPKRKKRRVSKSKAKRKAKRA